MAKLVQFWTAIQNSYWFIPSVMSLGAALLSFLLAAADGWLGNSWIDAVPWVYRVQASGARDVLTTVAGSMIGVAGVTFSITIAALSYTTTILGPRLLTNFMSDKGNQVTLGTFLATFTYCLLLLRTIQASNDTGGTFVPHLSILFAIVLAMASLAVLIYFIHHIAESLHVSNVIADIAADLDRAIEAFDDRSREPAECQPATALPADFLERSAPIRATRNGYIQNLMHATIVNAACRHDLVVRVNRVPGDFVAERQILARVWPASALADSDIESTVQGAYAIGSQRTKPQDVMFLVNELVEIAARALSPGTNDPYTAMSCLDWLTASLNRLARRRMPSPIHRDGDDVLRLWVPVFDFETLANAIFDQLRCYFATDVNAAIHMLDRLGECGEFVGRAGDRDLLHAHAEALETAAQPNIHNPRDAARLDEAARRADRLLTHPDERRGALPA